MKRGLIKRVRIDEILLDLPPDMKTAKLRIDYSFDMSGPLEPAIEELFDAVLPKFPGRPALPNKFEILDAAAQAKAAKGKYRHVAFRFGKTPKHVTDLVNKNKLYFVEKVAAEVSATNKSK